MSTVLQLNPPLAVSVPHQNKRGYVYFFIDYGLDNEVWGVVDNATGELWWYQTKFIRFDYNITAGRAPPTT